MEESKQEIKPDICVIGGGAGGLTAASAAAAFGVNVVLVEKGRGDGETPDGGSLPSKALLAAAERFNAVRSAARFAAGLGPKAAPPFGVDFAAVRAHVHEVIESVRPQQTRERLNGLGVRLLDGDARFVDRDTVAVNGYAIKARRFVIATGSSPAVPEIPGLADTPYLTCETVLGLAECPRHLIVLGAGSVGLELAQAFRRLGADVTVLEAAAPLAGDDPECAAIVIDALEREGINLRSGVRIARVRRMLARVQVDIAGEAGEERVEGSHLLVAVGHAPNLAKLDLDAAGIRYAPTGIVIDRRMRTTNRQVYAIGDVVDGPRSTHRANHHAGLVVRNALFRTPVNADEHAVPSVTYTNPELAQVGLMEDEARAHAGAIRVLRWPYRENDRAWTTGAINGHIKIITDRKGRILGATIVGAGATENISAWALAINQGLTIEAFAGVIVPYPTYAEVGKRAAMTYFTRGLTSPLVRRIIGWLRRFG